MHKRILYTKINLDMKDKSIASMTLFSQLIYSSQGNYYCEKMIIPEPSIGCYVEYTEYCTSNFFTE